MPSCSEARSFLVMQLPLDEARANVHDKRNECAWMPLIEVSAFHVVQLGNSMWPFVVHQVSHLMPESGYLAGAL